MGGSFIESQKQVRIRIDKKGIKSPEFWDLVEVNFNLEGTKACI